MNKFTLLTCFLSLSMHTAFASENKPESSIFLLTKIATAPMRATSNFIYFIGKKIVKTENKKNFENRCFQPTVRMEEFFSKENLSKIVMIMIISLPVLMFCSLLGIEKFKRKGKLRNFFIIIVDGIIMIGLILLGIGTYRCFSTETINNDAFLLSNKKARKAILTGLFFAFLYALYRLNRTYKNSQKIKNRELTNAEVSIKSDRYSGFKGFFTQIYDGVTDSIAYKKALSEAKKQIHEKYKSKSKLGIFIKGSIVAIFFTHFLLFTVLFFKTPSTPPSTPSTTSDFV